MPTGYTDIIHNGCDFKTFALKCTQQFCRKEYPEQESKYILILEEILKKLQNELEMYNSLTDDACEFGAIESYHKEESDIKKQIKKLEELREKYEIMLDKVYNWIPPTEDHFKLKLFMENQIKQSIIFDCDIKYLKNKILVLESGKDWKDKNIKSIESGIEYYTNEYNRRLEKQKNDKEWLDTLLRSL